MCMLGPNAKNIFFAILAMAGLEQAWAAASIQCESAPLPLSAKVRACNAAVTLDDLFSENSIAFKGLSESDAATFEKSEASSQLQSNGLYQVVWSGTATRDNGDYAGSAMFLQETGGPLFGTVSYHRKMFVLKEIASGMMRLEEMQSSDAKPTKALYKKSRSADNSIASVESSQSEASIWKPPALVGGATVSRGDGLAVTRNDSDRKLRLNRRVQSTAIMDVLWIVTNRAMCEMKGLTIGCDPNDNNKSAMNQALASEVAKMNTSMSNVDVDAQIRNAGIIYLENEPSLDFNPDDGTSLDWISSNADPLRWRDEAGADLVALITGEAPNSGGIAYLNSYESVSTYDQFPYFVVAHELGHNLGCQHDRANTDDNVPYAHGYQDPQQRFRSIMSYNCPNGCDTVQYFSSRDHQFNGSPIGSATEDNARKISETAPLVAAWKAANPQTPTRPTPTPPTPTPPTPTPPTPTPPTASPSPGLETLTPSPGTETSSPTQTPPTQTPPTPTPPPPTQSPGTETLGGTCFSGKTTVETPDGVKNIRELRVGDHVRAGNDLFSKVYMFSHVDHDYQEKFVRISAGDNQLELSPAHMVFLADGYPIPAREVKIGDELRRGQFVTKLDSVTRRGIYAPVTFSGDIQVDGVLASCFVELMDDTVLNQHAFTHIILSPVRWLCTYDFGFCENAGYTNDGLSNWTAMLSFIVTWLNEQHFLLQIAVTFLTLPIFGVLAILDAMAFAPPFLLFGAGVAALIARRGLNSKKSKTL